jgi:hypothetical protein
MTPESPPQNSGQPAKATKKENYIKLTEAALSFFSYLFSPNFSKKQNMTFVTSFYDVCH